jgi:hypothetical protein
MDRLRNLSTMIFVKAIFVRPSAIEVVPLESPDGDFSDPKTFRKNRNTLVCNFLKRRVSVSMLCFDCRLHDIAEQKFLYPVWSLGMVVEGIV